MAGILICAGGSNEGNVAIAQGLRLARLLDLGATVLFVSETERRSDANLPQDVSEFFEAREALMNLLQRRVKMRANETASSEGIPVKFVALNGEPGKLILSQIEERKPRYVVIGKNGMGSAEGSSTVGRIARRILKASSTSVIVAGRKTSEGKDILICDDHSPEADAAARTAIDLAAGLGKVATYLAVSPRLQELKFVGEVLLGSLEDSHQQASRKRYEVLKKLGQEREVRIHYQHRIGHPAREIIEKAGKRDFVAMGRHAGETDMLGGTILKVLRQAECPVLVDVLEDS